MVLKVWSILFVSVVSLLAGDTFYYSKSKKVYLSPVEASSSSMKSSLRVPQGINYYKTQNDSVVGVSNKLIVKFISKENFDEIVKTFNLTFVKEIYKDTYLFELKDNTNTLDIANELYNLEDIKYAHPNFIRETKLR